MVSVSVATRAILKNAVIVGLWSETICLSCSDIDVLMTVMMMAAGAVTTVISREDFFSMVASVADALSTDSGNEGDKQSGDLVHFGN